MYFYKGSNGEKMKKTNMGLLLAAAGMLTAGQAGAALPHPLPDSAFRHAEMPGYFSCVHVGFSHGYSEMLGAVLMAVVQMASARDRPRVAAPRLARAYS